MNPILKLLGVTQVVDQAQAAVQQKADETWQQLAPYVYVAAFMAVTAWIFYFVPRFRLPWEFEK